MVKINVSDATPIQLDWLVAQCPGMWPVTIYRGGVFLSEGEREFTDNAGAKVILWQSPDPWSPSTNWLQGGPLIERERINLLNWTCGWDASMTSGPSAARRVNGDTPLIAAMRCYVASKLGDEIEIPEELA